MKAFVPLLPLLLVLGAGCDVQDQGPAKQHQQGLKPLEAQAQAAADCVAIVSALERLACFDQRDGTPPQLVTEREPSAAPQAPLPVLVPSIADWVRDNEGARTAADQNRFLLKQSRDLSLDQPQLVISAPALGVAEQRPYLVISCMSRITRLQLLVDEPIAQNQIQLRLLMDERPLTAAKVPWQVLEVGNLVDAGRGLVAIEQLRRLSDGARLRLESDYIPFDGLVFDATGLKALVDRQREACHW